MDDEKPSGKNQTSEPIPSTPLPAAKPPSPPVPATEQQPATQSKAKKLGGWFKKNVTGLLKAIPEFGEILAWVAETFGIKVLITGAIGFLICCTLVRFKHPKYLVEFLVPDFNQVGDAVSQPEALPTRAELSLAKLQSLPEWLEPYETAMESTAEADRGSGKIASYMPGVVELKLPNAFAKFDWVLSPKRGFHVSALGFRLREGWAQTLDSSAEDKSVCFLIPESKKGDILLAVVTCSWSAEQSTPPDLVSCIESYPK